MPRGSVCKTQGELWTLNLLALSAYMGICSPTTTSWFRRLYHGHLLDSQLAQPGSNNDRTCMLLSQTQTLNWVTLHVSCQIKQCPVVMLLSHAHCNACACMHSACTSAMDSRTKASSGWSACSGGGCHCQLLRWCSQSWNNGEASAMRACSSRLLQSSMARRCRRRCLDLFTHMARHQPCTCMHAQPSMTRSQAMRTATTVERALARDIPGTVHDVPMLMHMACMVAGWWSVRWSVRNVCLGRSLQHFQLPKTCLHFCACLDLFKSAAGRTACTYVCTPGIAAIVKHIVSLPGCVSAQGKTPLLCRPHGKQFV